jgi:hypothetical protein
VALRRAVGRDQGASFRPEVLGIVRLVPLRLLFLFLLSPRLLFLMRLLLSLLLLFLLRPWFLLQLSFLLELLFLLCFGSRSSE